MLWSGLFSFIRGLVEIAKWTDSGCQGRLYMLMSDLTHRLLAYKAHLNLCLKKVPRYLYIQCKFITNSKYVVVSINFSLEKVFVRFPPL